MRHAESFEVALEMSETLAVGYDYLSDTEITTFIFKDKSKITIDGGLLEWKIS